MAWVAPKTNWVNGDYFNIDPDYNRIKGNIEYVSNLSKELYREYQTKTLEDKAITDYPDVNFFNNVSESIEVILSKCYRPVGSKPMRLCVENGQGWTATDLNNIESNLLRLYQALEGQKKSIRRLSFVLGGLKIGT